MTQGSRRIIKPNYITLKKYEKIETKKLPVVRRVTRKKHGKWEFVRKMLRKELRENTWKG